MIIIRLLNNLSILFRIEFSFNAPWHTWHTWQPDRAPGLVRSLYFLSPDRTVSQPNSTVPGFSFNNKI
jgi:hypothetical protein